MLSSVMEAQRDNSKRHFVCTPRMARVCCYELCTLDETVKKKKKKQIPLNVQPDSFCDK